MEKKVWEKLREVMDPGANLNVVDMGLIKELSVSDEGVINIVLRPSSPVCPLAFVLAANIKEALEEMEETRCVNLKIVDFVRAGELNKMMAEA
jgi:metal-sulfur cluster biosynthetic enzyme